MNRYLCNNKANLLTRLGTRCQKIPGTGPGMTGAGGVGLVPVGVFLIPLTRHFVPTSPASGKVNGLLRFARNDNRERDKVTRLLRFTRNDDRARGEVV